MSCVRENWKKKKTTTTTTNRESFGKKFSTPCTGRESNPGLPRAGENSTTEPPVPFDGVPSVLTKKIA